MDIKQYGSTILGKQVTFRWRNIERRGTVYKIETLYILSMNSRGKMTSSKFTEYVIRPNDAKSVIKLTAMDILHIGD